MRRSRLYLALSIVSLMVAFGLGVAENRCRFANCSVPTPDLEYSAARAERAAWDAFYSRDFDRMNEQATRLLDHPDPSLGIRLRAYALRGQGRYEEAAAAYEECMFDRDGNGADLPVKCDAHIGLAHCRHMLGDSARAREEIEAALTLAHLSVRMDDSEAAHYQLACVCAVQSGTLTGDRAHKARLNAIGAFQRAIELGFDGWRHARADLDLDALRGQHEFQSLFPKP